MENGFGQVTSNFDFVAQVKLKVLTSANLQMQS